MLRVLLCGLLWLTLLVPVRAFAHAAPHSVILLDLREGDVAAELRLPVPELALALGAPPADAEVRALVSRDLHFRSLDGSPWSLNVGKSYEASDEQGPVVVVTALATPTANRSARSFVLQNDVIGSKVVSHVAWIGLRSDAASTTLPGPPTFAGTTRYLQHEVTIERAGNHAVAGFRDALRLGRQHIAEGTDHLAFLFALLLPVPLLCNRRGSRWGVARPVGKSVREALRMVTAFTLGHSITLLAGTLGWLRLPTAPVEILVALSIVVSSVHAIRPLAPHRESYVAGLFGFVHGLAFASALADLQLRGARLALVLVGFNIGIELMQLVLIAATLPWLLLLARSPVYRWFRPLFAGATLVVALGWVGQRAFGLQNPTESFVTALASHPVVLLVGLAGLALGATLLRDTPGPEAGVASGADVDPRRGQPRRAL